MRKLRALLTVGSVAGLIVTAATPASAKACVVVDLVVRWVCVP